MTVRRLILESLVHYRRTNVGVALGVAVAAAVLVGALLVGDSVRASLRRQALQRVGQADLVLDSHDRLFRVALAAELQAALPGTRVAPALRLGGIASRFDAETRAGDVQVLGVDERFFALGLAPGDAAPPQGDGVLLNARLAQRLDVRAGDDILIRVEQPSAMPRDLVLATADDVSTALRLTVAGVLDDDAYGRFALAANQLPPPSAFVRLGTLQERLGLNGRANLLLLDAGDAAVDAERAGAALRNAWTLDDAELEIIAIDDATVELSSRRIFIDAPVVETLAASDLAITGALTGVLTYFVNELRSGDRATPYSMVTALGSLGAGGAGGARSAAWTALVPPDLADDGIVINGWLADDLDIRAGAPIEVRYYVPGPGRKLDVATADFTVRRVVPLTGSADDPSLMPAFPGLANAEHCRDWEPGIPVDLERVRDEDEAYWDEHRGTPKAFITLAEGRRLWSNRFGTLTAVRADAGDRAALAAVLRDGLDPAAVGLFFRPLRAEALAAGTSATDFGGLFLGLSIFLIGSALLLTALLFALGVEQRSEQIGTLLAIGWRARRVRWLLVGEGVLLALVGAAVGTAAGVAYTALVLRGLATIWADAVGSARIALHASPLTIAIGFGSAVVAAVVAIWLALRRQLRRPAARLLAGAEEDTAPTTAGGRGRLAVIIAGLSLVGAIAIIVAVGPDRGTAATGAFFGAGALLLVAGLAASRWLLAALGRVADRVKLSIPDLGVRNSARRRGRSLATVALLACGSFLVVAVGANRLDAQANAHERSSGTGGFALFGRSTLGVLHDLKTQEGRDAYGLTEQELDGVEIVPLRVRDGDEASCLNLSVPQQPRLVGVDPQALAERGAFTFARTLDGGAGGDATASPWLVLRAPQDDGAIPAVGDLASITWVMHKKVGDTIEYRDERGRPFNVRIVGAVANSILQGNLLIDNERFEELFPSESGYRMMLVDTPPDRAEEVSRDLTRALRDVGLELMPATQRLAEFNAVQNTYLSIFQILGGLGLLLGSAGLGMVVARNVLERRGELALLRAVGFRVRAVRWLVMSEHGLLLVLGLTCGGVAAVVAVLPAVLSPGAGVPWRSTLAILAAIALSGVAWVWLATVLVVRGELLGALRDE